MAKTDVFLQYFYTFFMIVCDIVEAFLKQFIPVKYRAKNISGQIVLLTGAGGGIGRPLALGLAKLGCRVVCWDVVESENVETVRLIKEWDQSAEAYAFTVDLTNRAHIYQAVEMVKKQVGKVDILINNAGVLTGKKLMDCTDEEILRTFDVNILSNFWTVRSFLSDMIERRTGHIVTIASAGGLIAAPRLVDYCSSKFAAVGFDEALRLELQMSGHHAIKTTIICPYYIKTPMVPAGAKTKLIPLLKPGRVVKETIDSILTNQQICVIPNYLNIFTHLKTISPVKAFERGTKMTGSYDVIARS